MFKFLHRLFGRRYASGGYVAAQPSYRVGERVLHGVPAVVGFNLPHTPAARADTALRAYPTLRTPSRPSAARAAPARASSDDTTDSGLAFALVTGIPLPLSPASVMGAAIHNSMTDHSDRSSYSGSSSSSDSGGGGSSSSD